MSTLSKTYSYCCYFCFNGPLDKRLLWCCYWDNSM